MRRVGRIHDIEMCRLMKAGYPSVSFYYPSGRRTSSLRSLVDRNGRYYTPEGTVCRGGFPCVVGNAA